MAMDLATSLRRAIDKAERAGTTRYSIGKAANLPQSTLSRFMRGQRGLGLDVAERVADVLGLRVVLVEKASKPARRGKGA